MNRELLYIANIGRQHGYSKSFLWKILNNVKLKLSPLQNPPNQAPRNNRDNFLSVPYNLKNLQVVKSIAKKTKKDLATRRAPTQFNLIRNEKDPLKPQDKYGVYKIPVIDNSSYDRQAYIGVTDRNLSKRLTEHRRDI